jgi:O-antigen ligase
VIGIYSESKLYEQKNEATSAGLRISFWTQSLRFIESAPLLGHGTGSIPDQFRRVAGEQSGEHAFFSSNPHNQTFAVGIQLGIVGIALLWAMWIAQLVLFRGPGVLAWVGLVIVMSNIVGSLFNSFIFDFTEGWLYVFGVGVAGGLVQRKGDYSATQVRCGSCRR